MSKNTGRRGSLNGAISSDIKFAGNDNKVKMYEPKHRRKLVRVLTVVAYVFSVSLAAIILSLFYMFIYSPGKSSVLNGHDAANMYNDSFGSYEKEEPRALPLSESETQAPKLKEKIIGKFF
ncbi:hypothetical protein RUM43_006829 [Polyplax serrata]